MDAPFFPIERMRVVNPLASENAEAKRLGFQMKIRRDAHEHVVFVRLVPTTATARVACQTASGARDLNAIEVAYAHPEAMAPIEAFTIAAKKALERAREAL